MPTDLSKVSSTPSNDEDIDINQVTNSGTDSDRDENTDSTPPSDATGGDSTPPSTTPPASDNDDVDDDKKKDAPKDEASELQNILTSLNGDDLDEEDSALRDELLEKHGGASFNDAGDIVDENGDTIISVDDLLKSINDPNESLNEKGDLVDADGKVIKTKAELAVENSVVNKLHADLDYEFTDEEGNVKVYSDDADGMQEFSDDMANYKLEQFKANFFSQNPELAEVSKHLLSGGSLDTFKQPTDYSKIDVKELTPEQKEKHIRDSFKAGGMADSRINSMVQRIKDSNELDVEAEEAVKDLASRDKEAQKTRDAQYQQAVEDRNKEVAKYWEEVQKTVKKGELSNVNIPDSDKDKFFEYISTPADEKGNSKEMLDASNETLEQKLAMSYIRFKGFKLGDLIDSKAQTKNVLSIRERLKRSAKQKPTPANDANGITSGNNVEVSIDSMLS